MKTPAVLVVHFAPQNTLLNRFLVEFPVVPFRSVGGRCSIGGALNAQSNHLLEADQNVTYARICIMHMIRKQLGKGRTPLSRALMHPGMVL